MGSSHVRTVSSPGNVASRSDASSGEEANKVSMVSLSDLFDPNNNSTSVEAGKETCIASEAAT
jgi:hypothetical protein